MISKCYLVEPFAIAQSASIAEAVKKLLDKDQRHIYVVDEDNKPVGILSTSDVLKKIVAEEKSSSGVTVKDVMTSSILVFDDEDDAKKAYKAMNEKGVVSCAVTQDGKLVGILTLKETVRFITDPKNID